MESNKTDESTIPRPPKKTNREIHREGADGRQKGGMENG